VLRATICVVKRILGVNHMPKNSR